MNKMKIKTLELKRTTLKALNGGGGNMEFDDTGGGSGSGPVSSNPLAFTQDCANVIVTDTIRKEGLHFR